MSEDANEGSEVLMPDTVSGDGIESDLSDAESSTASEDKHEQKSVGVQNRINDLTAKCYQAKRERDEVRKKLAELEANAPKPESQTSTTSAPSLPDDMYDEDAMRKYHADMLKHQQLVAESQAKAIYEQQQQQGAQKAREAEMQGKINTFAQNAARDGVDLEKLRGAEQILSSSGLSPELGQFLLADANGGKIVTHLADNPALMHEILSLPPTMAAVRIANEVKPQALSTTPKVTQAPEPIADVRGGGVEVKDDFDRTYAGYEIL